MPFESVILFKFEKITKNSVLAIWEQTGSEGYLNLENIGKWAWEDFDGILVDENTLEEWITEAEEYGNYCEDYKLALIKINSLNNNEFNQFTLESEDQFFDVENKEVSQVVDVAFFQWH